MFCEGRKQAMTKFIVFMNLDMVDRNSAPEDFACIWQSEWVGIITIETEKIWVHSSCDVFVVVSCRGILNSLIFTKAWSMQAWIPVLSSSLYFWKSVFSFRVDSGCLYNRLLSKTYYKKVSIGLTDRRKTAQNLVDSRKNWKNLNR